ncbi:MAG TPA: sulfur carrier protein ThiS [Natronosporangium sp.]|nr:sulfur carrier protein ThiS [Natronosporangium sp.]
MITVNGQPRHLPTGTPLADLVAELAGAHHGRGLAVAVNGEVVPRTSWATTTVTSGDRVEVLTATQGG